MSAAKGYVTCDKVKYYDQNLKTGKSISLIGKTIHTTGADGVTPGRFLGYEFRNKNYLYRVTEDGILLIYRGKKLIFKEQGNLTY